MNITANGINDAWLKVIEKLHLFGKESSPRGHKIKEIKNMSVEIKDPKKRILSLPIRNISLPFAFGEFLWYLSARNDVEMMEYYSARMKNFSDDGKTLNSAYGYRIFGEHPMLPFNQWDHVVSQLKNDPDTRQAIIHLHTPNNKPTKDEVCTLSLQFFIREGKLDMVVNMRSNDIIWGFTYDVFSFTSFQELMANELGIDVGTYYHNAASMHIYEKDFSYFENMTIFPELHHMTKYDTQFDYGGLTVNDGEWAEIFAVESMYRAVNKKMNNVRVETKALKIMKNVFWIYRRLKENGPRTALKELKYDNLYHWLMRNYIHKKKLEHSTMIIIDGCDGAGKTSLIDRVVDDSVYDVIAFGKPAADFNKLIYFQTALTKGNIILDRFYYSEWVYSRLFKRECMIDSDDVKVIESLLNFRNANYTWLNTDPAICLERLDDDDKKLFHMEHLKYICDGYSLTWNASSVKNKIRVNTEVVK